MNQITEESIKSKIRVVCYIPIDNTTIVLCIITLDNGFKVIGESACVDPKNFSLKHGEQEAYKVAFEKIWELEGYLLKEKIFQNTRIVNDKMSFGQAIEEMREGEKVTREGWNGKNMWIGIQKPTSLSDMSLPYIYMKTVKDSFVPWLASQTDMLAKDWKKVN